MDVKDSPVETPWQIALPVLRELAAELDAGIDALVRQDLEGFEKCVAAQGKLCDLLLETGYFSEPAGSKNRPTGPRLVDAIPAASELHALQELDHKKRVYAALLRRTKSFAQIVLGFHQSRNGYAADGPVPLRGSTWSSEV